MSHIFEVIPKEAKGVKRTAQVIEPLQVIPKSSTASTRAKVSIRLGVGVMPPHYRCVDRLLPLSTVHLSPSTHVCTSSPLSGFQSHHRKMNFNPTSCLVARNSAKSRKILVQKRRRMYPDGGFQAILESPME